MRAPARAAWLAATISIAAAASPALVGADQTSCQGGVTGTPALAGGARGGVNVHVTATKVSWCPAALIEASRDIPDGTNYPLQSTSQSPNAHPVSNAISINALLKLAGVNPATVGFTNVVRPSNGTWSTLNTADLSDQTTTFINGLKPIVWINGTETDYMRPQRTPTDANISDFIVADSGAPIDLYVHSGPLLDVTASATPTTVTTGQSVTFAAQVPNYTAADGALTYNWSFQDGTTASGASVTHRFTSIGTYSPTVTVQGAGNDSGGASPPVPVTVGAPPKSGTSGSPGANNPNHNAHTGGPSNSNGKTSHTTPSHKHTGGPGTNHSHGSNQSPATPQTTSPTQTTPSTPTASTPTPAASTHHAATAYRRSSSRKHAQPQHDPGTTVVKGRLVSDVIPVSSAQLASQNGAASPAHAPSAGVGGGSLTPVAGIIGGGAIILLLGSGAGLELRSQRRPVAPTRAA